MTFTKLSPEAKPETYRELTKVEGAHSKRLMM